MKKGKPSVNSWVAKYRSQSVTQHYTSIMSMVYCTLLFSLSKKQHEFVAPFVLAATMFHPALCQRDSEKTLAQLCCLNLLVFRRPIQWPPLPIRIFLGCRCFPWFSSLCNFVSVLLWPCCFKLHRSKHVPVVFLPSPFPFTHMDSLAFRFSCYICNANTA